MIKRFFNWFRVKEHLDSKNTQPPFFKEGEIWWSHFGENIGHELSGKGEGFTRPVYIFKKYNQYTYHALPITSKSKEGSWYVPIKMQGQKRVVVIAQGQTLDYRRLTQRVEQVSKEDQNKITDAYATLHKINPAQLPARVVV
ncbi:MAG: sulfate adenylyltransferase subunit CysN [Parcubacteria group bacterium]|nr:sulfate adenylyltransferase subunit CysN [Parcubacteria group bacterium]